MVFLVPLIVSWGFWQYLVPNFLEFDFFSTREKTFEFFAVYEIYNKNHSFSTAYCGVKILFCFQCRTANSFYSKINDSGRRRTIRFSSSRFGVRVCHAKNFYDLSLHFSIPEISERLKGYPTKFFGIVRQ